MKRFLVFIIALCGCGDAPFVAQCSSVEVRACFCGMDLGTQRCESDGTFGFCQCASDAGIQPDMGTAQTDAANRDGGQDAMQGRDSTNADAGRTVDALMPADSSQVDAMVSVDAAVDTALPDAVADAAMQPPPGMVAVPAGPFMMGCNPNVEPQLCQPDEMPYHMVTLSAFFIDRTEVTQGVFGQCVAAGACTAPSANYDPASNSSYPAVNVTWFQAVAYCAWAGNRLPTEAEWEKAARGTDGRIYPWGNAPPNCSLAITRGCGYQLPPGPMSGSAPAGASPYGMLDAAGSVYEWVADWYDPAYYAVSSSANPMGPMMGTERAVRGGPSYGGSDARMMRASYRTMGTPSGNVNIWGFRCARSAP